MALCSYSGEHFIPNLHFRCRKTPIFEASSLLDHSRRRRLHSSASSFKCSKKYSLIFLCSDNNPSPKSKPAPNKNSKNLEKKLPFIVKTFFGLSSAAATSLIVDDTSNSSGNGGGWNRGGGGGGGGSGGGSSGGGFWSRLILSPLKSTDEEEDQEIESSDNPSSQKIQEEIPAKITTFVHQVFKNSRLKGLFNATMMKTHLFDPWRKNTYLVEIVEGEITQLDIQFRDKFNNVCQGKTQLALIQRQLPKMLQQGHVYNHEAANQAFRNLESLGLFSSVQIIPRLDEKNIGGVVVEIKLKELPRNNADVHIAWNINPTFDLDSLIHPAGTVTLLHRNINGLNRSMTGEITSPNFFNPQNDLEFKFEYAHPYLDGVNNPSNRTFFTTCFNNRKQSPVYTGGPGADLVPPVWVHRAGIKTSITESFNHQSKFTYGLSMEKIMTLNEMGADYMVFAQANITHDNTRFVNGTSLGEKTVFQVEQGLGIGTGFPIFNRHQITHTQFLQLKQVQKGAPPVLVLHSHYGGCVGDLPGYNAFTIGGPNSVRGFNLGELGACRYVLEVAAEIRIPVKNRHVYAFVEHGNDLGSSKEVKGNPTEFYNRVGHGSSYGLGIKLLDQVRAEFVIKHNEGGSVNLRFGERF